MATLSYADAAKAFQNASASSAQNIPAVSFAHDWQSNNLDPATAQALLKVDQALAGTVPGLTVTSAYRPADYNAQVGGAQGSQHISGKAIDLDLSSFSPQQKQAVLNAVMAQPEIKGIGVYDKNLNTLHFDTRAGDRVAWGPDYTSASLGSVLNGYTQPMLTGWLNGAPTAASAVTAMATGTPLPNLRPADVATAAPAAPQPPGSPGFVDNLGGGMSPLHQFSVAEPSDIPPGPYGAEAVLQAALSGDPAALQAAMASVMSAAIQKDSVFGIPNIGAIKNNLQSYFDAVQQQAPGAVRGVQTNLATNQALNAVVPDVLRPMLDSAFAALPPKSAGQVAMPNLRPPGGPSTPPLVASAPDTAPKMASFTPPSQPLPFDAGDNLDVRTTPGTANASPVVYSPPAASAADFAQLLGRGSSQEAPPSQNYAPSQPSVWDQNALQPPTGSPSPSAWDQGLPNGPQQYWTPPPAAPDPSQFLSSLTGGYGPATQSTMGPSPMLSSLTGGYGAANGWQSPPPGFDPNAYDPLADAGVYNKMLPQTKQLQIGQVPSAPRPQPMPQASPLAAALVGPLQDYGSVTPPQTQQMQNLYDAYQNQGDSYLNYNPFSYGQQ